MWLLSLSLITQIWNSWQRLRPAAFKWNSIFYFSRALKQFRQKSLLNYTLLVTWEDNLLIDVVPWHAQPHWHCSPRLLQQQIPRRSLTQDFSPFRNGSPLRWQIENPLSPYRHFSYFISDFFTHKCSPQCHYSFSLAREHHPLSHTLKNSNTETKQNI